MAEGILRSLAETYNLPWEVGSAAVGNYHIGASPHLSSQKICQLNQIDISQQRARLFVAEDFQSFDLIYAMDSNVLSIMEEIAEKYQQQNTGTLFLEELYPGQQLSVSDPWGRSESDFEEVFQVIMQGCRAIVHKHAGISL